MSSDYPLQHEAGSYVARFDVDVQDWPREESTFKDGTTRIRAYASRPRRLFSLEYDCITRDWADTLYDHFAEYGGGDEFNLQFPPRPSTVGLTYSTVSVRYRSFKFRRPGFRGIDPWIFPSLRVELEEVL